MDHHVVKIWGEKRMCKHSCRRWVEQCEMQHEIPCMPNSSRRFATTKRGRGERPPWSPEQPELDHAVRVFRLSRWGWTQWRSTRLLLQQTWRSYAPLLPSNTSRSTPFAARTPWVQSSLILPATALYHSNSGTTRCGITGGENIPTDQEHGLARIGNMIFCWGTSKDWIWSTLLYRKGIFLHA
jgi:hypothetical protein